MKIIVRGWGDGRLLFEDPLETEGRKSPEDTARRQIETATAYEKHMIEIEFVEEPDPMQRFFRFGNDKSMMEDPRPWIECPKCGKRSYNPNDIKHRYCGNCHEFHEA